MRIDSFLAINIKRNLLIWYEPMPTIFTGLELEVEEYGARQQLLYYKEDIEPDHHSTLFEVKLRRC